MLTIVQMHEYIGRIVIILTNDHLSKSRDPRQHSFRRKGISRTRNNYGARNPQMAVTTTHRLSFVCLCSGIQTRMHQMDRSVPP